MWLKRNWKRIVSTVAIVFLMMTGIVMANYTLRDPDNNAAIGPTVVFDGEYYADGSPKVKVYWSSSKSDGFQYSGAYQNFDGRYIPYVFEGTKWEREANAMGTIGSGQGEYQNFAETVPVYKNGKFWAYGNVYDNGQYQGHTFVNGYGWINTKQDAIVTYLNRNGYGEVVREDYSDNSNSGGGGGGGVREEMSWISHGKCDLSIKKRADARAPAMSF